jgi:hypothetical protein
MKSLKWLNENSIICGSLEHSIKIFDPEVMEVKEHIATQYEAITCLDA